MIVQVVKFINDSKHLLQAVGVKEVVSDEIGPMNAFAEVRSDVVDIFHPGVDQLGEAEAQIDTNLKAYLLVSLLFEAAAEKILYSMQFLRSINFDLHNTESNLIFDSSDEILKKTSVFRDRCVHLEVDLGFDVGHGAIELLIQPFCRELVLIGFYGENPVEVEVNGLAFL